MKQKYLLLITPNKIKKNTTLVQNIEILSLKDILCLGYYWDWKYNWNHDAELYYSKYGYNCFLNDSGLEVEALDGKTRWSARYAGDNGMMMIIWINYYNHLQHTNNRKANFKSSNLHF
jgi:XTP/dITP diphosphohydrolase